MAQSKQRHTGLRKPWMLGLSLCLLAPGSSAPAQQSGVATHRHAFRARFDGYAFLRQSYDDNVFDYSQTDRNTFDTATAALQRFPIEKAGDYVTEFSARADYVWSRGRHTSTRGRLRYDADLYARNTFRNYHQLGAEWRLERRHSYVEASLRWLPKYYLRHLYWRPMPERPVGVRYAPATFTKYAFDLEWGGRLVRRLDARIVASFDRRDYDFPFDERDNNTYGMASRVTIGASHRLDLYLEAELATSRAAGADSASPAVVDVSNHRRALEVGFEWALDRGGRLRLAQSLAYGHQSYTTGNVADLQHHGRRDDEYRWETDLTWHPVRSWQPRLYYAYRKGTTTADLVGATDVGSFTGNRLGLQLVRYF